MHIKIDVNNSSIAVGYNNSNHQTVLKVHYGSYGIAFALYRLGQQQHNAMNTFLQELENYNWKLQQLQ